MSREYTAGDGTPIYCTDKEEGVRCPYTGIFVPFYDTCLTCKNHYQESDQHAYCLRSSTQTASTESTEGTE